MKPKKNENGAPASAGTASAGTDAAGKPSAAAVICAAGRSSRMGGIKKEYRRLPGRDITVLGAAVSAFAAVPGIQTIVIAVPAGHQSGEARNALPQRFLSGENGPAVRFVTGAETRRASVFNALSFLSGGSPPDIVLIHDGARPWLSPSLVERVIAGAGKYGAVIPLVPLADTPKETDLPLDSPGGAPVFVKRHLRRAFTGAAQT
ncbi:MAG: 2-C-methyl-D-erythritol 4-phosphate cytidylyltransferase, partial [Treponema sp.]|nr:2-C-methyl-D-erythritol 4-phosphate cytidylyltransferase [Treponema sp.]